MKPADIVAFHLKGKLGLQHVTDLQWRNVARTLFSGFVVKGNLARLAAKWLRNLHEQHNLEAFLPTGATWCCGPFMLLAHGHSFCGLTHMPVLAVYIEETATICICLAKELHALAARKLRDDPGCISGSQLSRPAEKQRLADTATSGAAVRDGSSAPSRMPAIPEGEEEGETAGKYSSKLVHGNWSKCCHGCMGGLHLWMNMRCSAECSKTCRK